MSAPGDDQGVPDRSPAGLIGRIETRVRPVVDRVLALPPAVIGMDLMDRYGAAGGGVTAAGLAYSVLVAILPTLLILVSILGFMVSDPAERDRILAMLAAQVPPLEELIGEMLKQISAGAWTFSLIGLIGLIWGASRVYAALDTSVALFFPREPRRDIVRQTIESLACVVFFLGSVLGAVALLIWVADLSIVPTANADAVLRRLVAVLLLTGWLVSALWLSYWYIPARHITARDALVPAIAAGVAVSFLTQIFAIIAPIFFKSLRIYGTFFALFAALIWLSLCTQVVLLGVSWVARRVHAPTYPKPGTLPLMGRPAGDATADE